MRAENQEMFVSRKVVELLPEGLYSYEGANYELEVLLPKLVDDRSAGVGSTFKLGETRLDFSSDEVDNETIILSWNEKEWKHFTTTSEIPVKFHIFVLIEVMMAALLG